MENPTILEYHQAYGDTALEQTQCQIRRRYRCYQQFMHLQSWQFSWLVMQLAIIKAKGDKMNKKEEFEVKGKKYLLVQPCGMLYTQGREYFLLHPYPIEPDWENDIFERRFVVVPMKTVDFLEDTGDNVHAVARHIVCTAPYLIDYNDMPLIIIETNPEVGLEDTELPVKDVGDLTREEQELLDEMIGLEGVG